MKHYNNVKIIVTKILAIEDISKIGDFEDFMDELGISLKKEKKR